VVLRHYEPPCIFRKDDPMRTRRSSVLLLFALMAGLVAGPGVGQQSKGDPSDKEAIAKNAEAFVEAFAKGDAAAVAAFWTEDADVTGATGVRLKGRAEIEKALKTVFAENKGLQLRIESDSLRFLTPDVAIEDGTSYSIPFNGAPPTRIRYTIVHVKKDGKWYLNSMRNAPYVPPSNYEHLRVLEWIVGNWSAESETGEAEHLSLSWTDNQNFIVGTFKTSVKGVSVGEATHWVGWDPRTKRIRSWIFDAAGGFGEGEWIKEGDKWVLKTTSVHPDGKPASMTVHLGPVDANTISLQATKRNVNGETLPDTREFRLKRVK
jgi:uncharacterized protein (TIGR02246 family)